MRNSGWQQRQYENYPKPVRNIEPVLLCRVIPLAYSIYKTHLHEVNIFRETSGEQRINNRVYLLFFLLALSQLDRRNVRKFSFLG